MPGKAVCCGALLQIADTIAINLCSDMKTTTSWTSGHAFDSFQNGAKIAIDAKAGFSPKALLLAGLAGCTGIDVVDILEKMKLPFAGLQIEVEAEQTEDYPKVFKDIHVHYRVGTAEVHS